MADEHFPFADVRVSAEGLSLPELKWRELVFIGAVRCSDGVWVRDPERPMPPFEGGEPFPAGRRFELVGREAGRVVLRQLP